MSKSKTIKTLSIAAGTAFVTSLAMTNIASAEGANPFAMNEMSGGYMQLAAMEGKCGGSKKNMDEGKYGGKMKKDGKCGEGKCGDGKKKMKKDGKCGEGKCGGKKSMKKGMDEGKCGGSKKKMDEGKCGGKK